MKAWRLALRILNRSVRSGRLSVLVVALTVAVAALTSVGFFIDRVRASVDREAAGVLAADLRLRSNERLNTAYLDEAQRLGLATAQIVSFPTVVMAGESSQLASLYAVSDAYPLRGQVTVADDVAAATYTVRGGPLPGRVWAEAGLLARLDMDVGDRLTIGESVLSVERILTHRPDQTMGFDAFAPSLLMSLEDLEATDLVRPGSRVRWAHLFAGSEAQLSRFRPWLAEARRPTEQLQTAGRTSDRIQSAIDRARSYLSLASMITLLLAATAVAISARRYAATQVDGVALMKCLGATQSLVLGATLIELVLLGLITGLAGGALGYLAQFGIAALVADIMDIELPPPGLAPAMSGIVASLAVLGGFALPAMLTLRTVPPLRVLRHDAAPKPLPTAVSYSAALIAVLGLLIALVGVDELLVYSTLGLGMGAVLLCAAAWLLVKAIGPLRQGTSIAWRYGLANIARRSADSVAQVVAFGFGLSVLLLLSVVRSDLLDTWYASLPADAPNHFVFNIQPHETDGIRQVFEQFGRAPPRLLPMVRARLTQINGQGLAQYRYRGDGGWLTREANLSWAEQLDPTNEIIQGRWWAPGTESAEVSVEEEIVEGLGLKLGDRLSFDVAGDSLTAELTSVRRVKWDSLSPNFILVFNPAALEGFPATFLGAMHTSDHELILELARRYPSVTVVDLESLLEQIRSVMDRAAAAIQYVFLFTLLAGIIMLLAAVQATREERRYEVALLRTLGASRRRVLTGLITEFVSLGLLAGLLASLIAACVAYVLARTVFGFEYSPNLSLIAVGSAAGALLVGLSGTLATHSVVRQPPMGVLSQ